MDFVARFSFLSVIVDSSGVRVGCNWGNSLDTQFGAPVRKAAGG